MAKKNTKRKTVGLVCEETGVRMYYTTVSSGVVDKLHLLKYNPRVRRRTWFTQTNKNLGRNEVKKRK